MTRRHEASNTAASGRHPVGLRKGQIDALDRALSAVLALQQPADRALSAFFRAEPRLGQRDRAWIAETVFALLRRLRSLTTIAGTRELHRLGLATLVRVRGVDPGALSQAIGPRELEWLTAVAAAPEPDNPAIRSDLPDWLWHRLVAAWGEAEAAAIAESLLESAPLDLRINPLKLGRDQAIARLRADGIACTATPHSPFGVRLEGKPAIHAHALFVSGAIEVQDEGSQLVCMLVAPRRHEMVVDFCAGAGGKTLLLGAMMRSQGRLYAFDVVDSRLRRLRPRVTRAGLSNVQPVLIADERDERVKRLAGKIDRVLVDAPCSGTGTLRRNPDLKWRQGERDLAELTARQAAILAAAARLLEPAGRLVYATCSLLPEENDAIVDAFLATHPEFVERDSVQELVRQGVSSLSAPGPRLRLLPHRDGCDGFFGTILQRSLPDAPGRRKGPLPPTATG